MNAHTCWPKLAEYGNPRPECADCGAQLVRIAHSPDHLLSGRPCGFPERWRYCFIPETVVTAAARDPLTIPDWRLA